MCEYITCPHFEKKRKGCSIASYDRKVDSESPCVKTTGEDISFPSNTRSCKICAFYVKKYKSCNSPLFGGKDVKVKVRNQYAKTYGSYPSCISHITPQALESLIVFDGKIDREDIEYLNRIQKLEVYIEQLKLEKKEIHENWMEERKVLQEKYNVLKIEYDKVATPKELPKSTACAGSGSISRSRSPDDFGSGNLGLAVLDYGDEY